MLQRLATFTIHINVPTAISREVEDKLCNVLDLIDMKERIKEHVDFEINKNKILDKYVETITVEE